MAVRTEPSQFTTTPLVTGNTCYDVRAMRRCLKAAFVLSLLIFILAIAAWACGYTNTLWVQTPPAREAYAFKVWGDEAVIYRLTPRTPSANRAALLLQFPLRPVIAVSGLLVVLSGLGALHRRHAPDGHCPTCGYDLRASTERCPECGSLVKQGLAAT